MLAEDEAECEIFVSFTLQFVGCHSLSFDEWKLLHALQVRTFNSNSKCNPSEETKLELCRAAFSALSGVLKVISWIAYASLGQP